MLQKYFDTYSSLYISENTQLKEFKNKLNENTSNILETEKQINTLISKRLTEMEDKFPTEQTQEEPSETFIRNLKKLLHSTLNVLKTE